MMRRLRKLGQGGDTIVEVMIVLAILGMALSIAYATANKGLQQSRNAQEHSQALGVIGSQVELLRSAFADDQGGAIETQGPLGPFCLAPAASGVTIKPLASSGPDKFDDTLANDKLDNPNTYPSPCIQDTLYNVSVMARGDGTYDFRVRWNGIGQLGRQQEELTYKIGTLTAATNPGYPDPEEPEIPAPDPLNVTLTINGSAASSQTAAPGTTLRVQWSVAGGFSDVTCEGTGRFAGTTFPGSSGSVDYDMRDDLANGTSLTFGVDCARPNGAVGSKSITVTVTKTTFVYLGKDYDSCWGTTDWPCVKYNGAIYGCQYLAANYNPATQSMPPGKYRVTLEYANAGPCSPQQYPFPPPSSYRYEVRVWVGGSIVHNLSLIPPSGGPLNNQFRYTTRTSTFDINVGNAQQVGFDWVNDWANAPTGQDANFQINKVTFTKLQD